MLLAFLYGCFRNCGENVFSNQKEHRALGFVLIFYYVQILQKLDLTTSLPNEVTYMKSLWYAHN